MHILCSYSGISFQCEHFPGKIDTGDACHPVFYLPQKKLLAYVGKWAAGELTPTDSYLLFLATLKSSDLIHFRTSAVRTNLTDSIVANNMEHLVKVVSKISSIQHPAACFPQYVVSPETRSLGNVHHWIANWEDAYQDFHSGRSRDYDTKKLVAREAALERMIKNPHRPISAYSSQIADWAAVAGDFPTSNTPSPITGRQIPLSEYWKIVITKCASESSIFSIPKKDIAELLEHCRDNIPVGSIFSNALFKILESALTRQTNFLGLGDSDLSSGTFKILSPGDSVESANMSALIQSAPDHAPEQKEYPNKLAYLRAKMRYEMSLKYGTSQGDQNV
jgi:hypothetical protein